MTVRFSPEAEVDFANVVEHLVGRNARAADELSRRVFDVIDKLTARQFDGPTQTLRTGEVVQSWAVPPLRIYYQRHGETLRILRIHHQARSPIVR